jgi:hypothetical protein
MRQDSVSFATQGKQQQLLAIKKLRHFSAAQLNKTLDGMRHFGKFNRAFNHAAEPRYLSRKSLAAVVSQQVGRAKRRMKPQMLPDVLGGTDSSISANSTSGTNTRQSAAPILRMRFATFP